MELVEAVKGLVVPVHKLVTRSARREERKERLRKGYVPSTGIGVKKDSSLLKSGLFASTSSCLSIEWLLLKVLLLLLLILLMLF